jgi:hypothetical protein
MDRVGVARLSAGQKNAINLADYHRIAVNQPLTAGFDRNCRFK